MEIISEKQFDPEEAVYTTPNHTGVFTDTVLVAKVFGRRHGDVLRIIRRHLKNKSIHRRNCASISYLDKHGRKQEKYQLDRKAFLVLVLSFTGADADRFKGIFVDLFLKQEKELEVWREVRTITKQGFPSFMDALQELRKRLVDAGTSQPEGAFYATVNRKINKKVAALTPRGGLDHNQLEAEQEAIIAVIRLEAVKYLEKVLGGGMGAKEIRKGLYALIEGFQVVAVRKEVG